MKRTAAIFLGIILIFCFTAGTFSVLAAEPFAASAFEENPLYSGKTVETGGLDGGSVTADAAGYYADGEALYSVVKTNLLARRGSFVIKYVTGAKLSTRTARLNLLEKLFLAATEDSRSNRCDDGDYLRLAVSGYGYTAFTEDKVQNKLYYYTITAQFTYFATAAQEQQVTETVNALVREINAKPLSDYRRLMQAHRAICSRTAYNTTAGDTVHAAYGALVGGKSACQGYAAAFYRLARALGYPARIITSAKNSGNHAWNMVALGGKFYYADLTWDDENIDGKTGKSEFQYFLVSLKKLQKNDSAKEEHTADPLYYDTEAFQRRYLDNTDTKNYNASDATLLSNCAVAAKCVNGGKLTVRTPDGRQLTEGVHYRAVPQTTLYGSRYHCLVGLNGYRGTTLRRAGSGKPPAQQPKLKQ